MTGNNAGTGDETVADNNTVAGDDLVLAARRAALRSHSPHSGFRVGAAVRDSDGVLTVGTNIESASYGLTCCAERVALFSAYSAGSTDITAVAVSCIDAEPGAGAGLMMPCGACRQVISELAPDATVIVDGVGEFSVADLLPSAFKL